MRIIFVASLLDRTIPPIVVADVYISHFFQAQKAAQAVKQGSHVTKKRKIRTSVHFFRPKV